MRLQKGALIKVRAFGGKRIVRRFVGKYEGSVWICSEEEYQLATHEHRQPLCVGFPLEDVIGTVASNGLALSSRRSVTPPKSPKTKGKDTKLNGSCSEKRLYNAVASRHPRRRA